MAFITYVGLICGGYEYVRAYALDRMERALDETRRANKSLKHAIEVKERFLANVSHGMLNACVRAHAIRCGVSVQSVD
jgi:hypothetical protein